MTFDPKELLTKQTALIDRVHHKSGVDQYDPRRQGKPIQKVLVEEVGKIAAKIPNAQVMEPPSVKTYERASPKVQTEYAGDWSRIKDLNRCTLVVPTAAQIESAYMDVKAHFTTVRFGMDLQFFAEKVIRPDGDPINNPCGYSGYTVFVRSHDHKKAEIQINYPGILYAKSLPEFKNTFGADAEAAMRGKYPAVPGGLAHKLYEVWQNEKFTQVGKDHAMACKLYFEYFQSAVADRAKGVKALEALHKLKLPGVMLPRLSFPVVAIPRPYRGS